jgi:hypothetical protein
MSNIRHKTIAGLPEALPRGEQVLWQGSPDWRAFAVRVFHTRFVAGYFAILIAWSMFSILWEGGAVASVATSAAWLSLAGALGLGLLGALAWLIARTTVYTLTNKRVAMRFGVALPMTVNIPLRCVESAGLRVYPNGTGDIPLKLAGTDRFAYLHLWPNVRPMRFNKAEPMIRAIPEAQSAAQLIANALVEVHGSEAEQEAGSAAEQVRHDSNAQTPRRAGHAGARPLAAAE